MDKEKQIEEMTRIAIEALSIFNAKNYNVIHKMCEALYNKDYRKQSDIIDEFAERLKAEAITIQDHTGKLGSVVLIGTIDRIANEMKGEGK